MVIRPNGDVLQTGYVMQPEETKAGTSTAASSGAVRPSASVRVTLSEAAQRLANQRPDDTHPVAELPSLPDVPLRPKKAGKRPPSQLALLDVDAMRTIRDKLRAHSLDIREPGVQEKKLREDQQENNVISL